MREVCANCGRPHPRLVWCNGQWYCPGACDVTRKRKAKPGKDDGGGDEG